MTPLNPTRNSFGRFGRRWRGLLPLMAVLILGMTSGPATADVEDYFRDRGEDFLDIFRLRFLAPYRANGYGVKARATALAQVGYVHFVGDAYGMDRRAIGHNTEVRTEGGVSVVYFSRTEMEKVSGNGYLDSDTTWAQAAPRGIIRNGGHWDDGRLHPVSVGAEVELGVFGLDIGLYPTELVDFVFGWFTLDIYKDDRSYTDDLPEYGTGVEEEMGTGEPSMAPGTAPAGPMLLPQEEQPAAPMTAPERPTEIPSMEPSSESTESTLDSEFVSPKDLEEFKSNETSPGMESMESPVNGEMESPPEVEEPEAAPEPQEPEMTPEPEEPSEPESTPAPGPTMPPMESPESSE